MLTAVWIENEMVFTLIRLSISDENLHNKTVDELKKIICQKIRKIYRLFGPDYDNI
jgi:hypothetical protein